MAFACGGSLTAIVLVTLALNHLVVPNAFAKKQNGKAPAKVQAIPPTTQTFVGTFGAQSPGAVFSEGGPTRNGKLHAPEFVLSGMPSAAESQVEFKRVLTPSWTTHEERNRFPFSIAFDPAKLFGAESSWRVIFDQRDYFLNRHFAERNERKRDERKNRETLAGISKSDVYGVGVFEDMFDAQATVHEQGASFSGRVSHCWETWPYLCAQLRPQLNISDSLSALPAIEASLELANLPLGGMVRFACQAYSLNFDQAGGAVSLITAWDF